MHVVQAAPTSPTAESGVRFILYTDIYQSSRLTELYPQQYEALLNQHNSLTEDRIAAWHGQLYQHTGDGYIALFDRAADCLACACELQSAYSGLPPVSADLPLLVRVVAHGGLIRKVSGHFFSLAFNRANRICQVCHPGQVLISQIVRLAVEVPPAGSELVYLGEHHLRDLTEPEPLYQLSHPGFALSQFPPLPTLSSRPNNLIAQTNTFVGRRREMEEIKALLASGARCVTLIAPGGYGKSRLAAHLCAELLPQFERGVFCVDLDQVSDHGEITAALAQALTFQFYGQGNPAEQLVDYLREKEMLLCFDNFEHLSAGAALVAEILHAAPGVVVLATSREALRITSEQVYPLDPLPVDLPAEPAGTFSDAELLFADRATRVNPGFMLDATSAPLVMDICAKLNGIPLAIELAAAWADSITLKELDAELEQQLELTARHADVPSRHRSLRASLDWSWNLLAQEQQEQLMKLSAFRGGCFAAGASAVLGIQGLELRRRLAALIDKSWLQVRELHGEARYLLRDAVSYEYSREKLQEHREMHELALLSQARYISGLVELEGLKLRGREQLAAQTALGLELPNINLALDALLPRSHDHPAASKAIELLTPLIRWLGEYLYRIGEYRKIVERYQPASEALASLDSARHPAFWASLHLGKGLRTVGQLESAAQALQAARELAEELAEPLLVARALYELSSYKAAQGAFQQARELCNASLEIRRKVGSRSGIASCLGKLGSIEQIQGNLAGARELYQQALAINRELGDYSSIAPLLSNLAAKARARRNYDEALALYTESLALARQLGDRTGIARALNNLGILEQAQQRADSAREHYQEALEIFREIGDRTNIGHTLGNLAMLSHAQNQVERAREYYRQALVIVRETGSRGINARLANNLGTLEQDQGNLSIARELYAEALENFQALADAQFSAITLNNLGIVEQLLGNIPAARDRYLEALGIRREIADQQGLFECMAAAGNLLSSCGPADSAAEVLYGAQHVAAETQATLQPLEQQLLQEGLAAIEHPESGLSADERERLKAKAAGMTLDELADYARGALEQLEPSPS